MIPRPFSFGCTSWGQFLLYFHFCKTMFKSQILCILPYFVFVESITSVPVFWVKWLSSIWARRVRLGWFTHKFSFIIWKLVWTLGNLLIISVALVFIRIIIICPWVHRALVQLIVITWHLIWCMRASLLLECLYHVSIVRWAHILLWPPWTWLKNIFLPPWTRLIVIVWTHLMWFWSLVLWKHIQGERGWILKTSIVLSFVHILFHVLNIILPVISNASITYQQ